MTDFQHRSQDQRQSMAEALDKAFGKREKTDEASISFIYQPPRHPPDTD